MRFSYAANGVVYYDVFKFDEIDKAILEGLRDGKTSNEIGREVFRTSRNVEHRILMMCKRSNTKKAISLLVFALRNKIIEL
jgi:DNA-binding NarL/FixJ family response regulator